MGERENILVNSWHTFSIKNLWFVVKISFICRFYRLFSHFLGWVGGSFSFVLDSREINENLKICLFFNGDSSKGAMRESGVWHYFHETSWFFISYLSLVLVLHDKDKKLHAGKSSVFCHLLIFAHHFCFTFTTDSLFSNSYILRLFFFFLKKTMNMEYSFRGKIEDKQYFGWTMSSWIKLYHSNSMAKMSYPFLFFFSYFLWNIGCQCIFWGT